MNVFLCYYELRINYTNDTQYYFIKSNVVSRPRNFFFYYFIDTYDYDLKISDELFYKRGGYYD